MRIILIFTAVIITYVIATCNSISTKTYRLTTPLLKEQSNIKIVLIADLHGTIHGKDQSVLVNKIRNANPDLIILAGDIYDGYSQADGTRMLLAEIHGIAPIYGAMGNHEYWGGNIRAVREEFISFGVTILEDSYTEIEVKNNRIILAGANDPVKKEHGYPNYDTLAVLEKAFRELDTVPLYKILIAHRFSLIEYYKKLSFNLVLSGHSHGGQVRIPYIINGLYTPSQGFFPKYAGGLYRHGNLTQIVSRGLSIIPWRPRIFNPPELVIVVINE
jgi:predicted MPP superfamily phosphohydrolase